MSAEGSGYDAAYQGAPGAYSEEAARAFVGPNARLLPRPTLEEMFDAVASGAARHGVLPIENCLTGAVPNALDLLLAHDLKVAGETQVHIDHVLIAPHGTRLADVKRVLSHPVALAQCRRFFARHPELEPVPAFDTAGAVEIVMREADGRSAALASRRAADLYGADILAEHLQDHAENWTRFLLISPDPETRDTAGPRKALVIFELPHEPGSLLRALEPLARLGANLTRIQSQPVHGRPFEYRFVVEMTADSEQQMRAAIDAMRGPTRSLRVFGSYSTVSLAQSEVTQEP